MTRSASRRLRLGLALVEGNTDALTTGVVVDFIHLGVLELALVVGLGSLLVGVLPELLAVGRHAVHEVADRHLGYGCADEKHGESG
jgi:hypothetical protein